MAATMKSRFRQAERQKRCLIQLPYSLILCNYILTPNKAHNLIIKYRLKFLLLSDVVFTKMHCKVNYSNSIQASKTCKQNASKIILYINICVI